jgi:uncharacterized damage-inducible protein DinB
VISVDYVQLMAAYTAWQNQSLYAAADTLSDEERTRDRGAFFGSIAATLNHVLWGDQFWLHRLAGTEAPTAMDIQASVRQYPAWEELRAARRVMDGRIQDWARGLAAADIEGELGWFSAGLGAHVVRPRSALIVQLFNHGTHHRGQVHAMLTAAGARPGDTDIQFMPASCYPWPD